MENLENIEEVLSPAEEVIGEENEIAESVVEEEVSEECEPAAAAETEPEAEPAVEEEPAATYNLNDVVEYQDLMIQYSELETKYNTLVSDYESMNAELEELRTFKASIDKKEKESMINSFYMLSDEDKKDVIENIDTYSIDEIEAKLSIICVRNRVSFNLEEEDNIGNEAPIVYNFSSCEDSSTPAWVKSLRSVAEDLK